MATKVFFMGTPDFAAESLRALIEDPEIEVAGVFTQPDKPVGRKQRLEAPPVKRLAEERGIPVWQPVKLRDGSALELIKAAAPELIAVVAYGRILPDEILEYPRLGCINIHGSILPKYRGSAPIQWSVINGDSETGVTAMHMAHDMDAGDIIEIRKTEIKPGETAGELFVRLAPIGAKLLVDTVHSLARGETRRIPQNLAEVTFAPPLTKELCPVSMEMTAKAFASRVLGLDPWPVAELELNNIRLKLYKAELVPDRVSEPAVTKAGLIVPCADGCVLVREVQASGGKRMAAADYFRGHPLC